VANTNGENFATTFSEFGGEGIIQPIAAETYVVTGSSGVASITYYLMRGTAGGVDVYWYATTIDATAAEYTGAGPVTNIKLIKRKQ
jgi:hypothetical protein